MRAVDYIEVLNGSADLCALDRANLSTADFRTLRDMHSNRLAAAWEFDLWPEIVPAEQRFFRAAWVIGTNYGVGTSVGNQVWYALAGKYYQSLHAANLGNAPATLTGGVWVTSTAHWAEFASGETTGTSWSATTTYAVGDKVSYGGIVYQLYIAAAAGTAPTDATKWGQLTDFDRYVAFAQSGQTVLSEGQVLGVWDRNPRVTTRAAPLSWFLSENGVQVISPVSWCWVEFRRECPELKGEPWSATTTYAAGDQVWDVTSGNFYDGLQPGNLNNLVTDGAFWAVTQIPWRFRRYLVHAGAGDWLRTGERMQEADRQMGLGQGYLEAQQELLRGQQGQIARSVVGTR